MNPHGLNTLAKIGLVLAAAGLSIVAGTEAALLGWLAFGLGVVFAFGPDLVAFVRPRAQRRRDLAERVVRLGGELWPRGGGGSSGASLGSPSERGGRSKREL